MQVHYGEGIVNQTGPESCAVYREVCCEALTGESVGQPLSWSVVEQVAKPDRHRALYPAEFGGGARAGSRRLIHPYRIPWPDIVPRQHAGGDAAVAAHRIVAAYAKDFFHP